MSIVLRCRRRRCSFPFHGPGWFVCDVVDDAVHLRAHGVGDLGGDPVQDVVGDVAVGRGHGVDALDAADRDGVAVRAFVAVHAHGLDGDEDGEVLPGHLHLVFLDGVFDFCFDDVAGLSDDFGAFFGRGADDADGEAWPWNGWRSATGTLRILAIFRTSSL